MKNAERGSHGGGYADCWRAANHHVADSFGDFAVVGVGVADFLSGKKALVEHHYAAVGPFDGLGYVHSLRILNEFAPRVRWSARPRAGTVLRSSLRSSGQAG